MRRSRASPAVATEPCAPSDPVAPALQAGFTAGDEVVAVDGVPVEGGRLEVVQRIRSSPGVPVTLTVERAGERRDIQVTPVTVTRPSLFEKDATERVGAVGIALQENVVTERVGFVEGLEASAETGKLFAVGIKRTVTEKLGTITDLYGPERDPEGLIGIVGAGRISGEVLASTETPGVKALSFVLLVASLNLFVGLFNLLPLLPLDGGHIAVAVYEGARDKLRRLRGYRGPLQRVDYTRLLPLTYGVAGTFLLLTLFILGADIVNPIRIS